MARSLLVWISVGAIAVYLLGCAVIVIAGLCDNLHRADVAVVLGTKVNPDGSPSVMLEARLDETAELYRRGYFKLILVSGGHGKEGYDEPAVMRQVLVRQGIPASVIFEDNNGITTWQTARSTVRFLREHHLRSVLIISQYFHIPRCRLAFARQGIGPIFWCHVPFWNIRDFYSVPREIIGFADYSVRSAQR